MYIVCVYNVDHISESVFKCYIVFLYFRAGKGVFSAMKLGKARSSKDNHKKGKCLHLELYF